MTTGEKLAKLRKENNYTQEQLAELLKVSRQSVSKWELDIVFPETEKLIQLSKLYQCTVDYLLKDTDEEKRKETNGITISIPSSFSFEWKSKKTLFGKPLVHVNFGLGRVADGIISFGLVSKGLLSFGIFSMGLLSFGIFSLGLISLGCFVLGLLSAGAISIGIMAFGGIAVGIFACGGVAIGQFAIGGAAVAHHVAIGGHASGLIAIGNEKANGSIIGILKDTLHENGNYDTIINAMDENIPWYFSWLKSIMKWSINRIA